MDCLAVIEQMLRCRSSCRDDKSLRNWFKPEILVKILYNNYKKTLEEAKDKVEDAEETIEKIEELEEALKSDDKVLIDEKVKSFQKLHF